MPELVAVRGANIQLLTARTTTNGAPSLATDGVALAAIATQKAGVPRDLLVLVASTAGSATMTVTLKLWGYSQVSAQWHPLGTSPTDANKGRLNEQNAIGETATDLIQHAELLVGAGYFERLYAEVVAIGGTATAVSVWIVG